MTALDKTVWIRPFSANLAIFFRKEGKSDVQPSMFNQTETVNYGSLKSVVSIVLRFSRRFITDWPDISSFTNQVIQHRRRWYSGEHSCLPSS